jgi:CubicO group peptidase (beta-lactamase class C family)
MRLKFLTISLILLTSCYLTNDSISDQDTWEYDLPRLNQMDQGQLESIHNYIQRGDYENIQTLMIVKNNKLVYEGHYGSSGRSAQQPIDRLTLIFTQLAIGMALEEGYLDSINAPIYPYLPSFEAIFENDPSKKEITFYDLLTHRAGFSWNESVISSESENNDINQMLDDNDPVNYLLAKPLEAVPGVRYNFNSGTGILLSKIIAETTGESLENFLKIRLLNPLDITDYNWHTFSTGLTDGSYGLSISPFDLLKMGQLYLDEGLWEGKEIIPYQWFLNSTDAQFFVTSQYGFGYYWNKFNPSFIEQYLNLTGDQTVFMTGYRGDALYLVPEKDLALVIFAENPFYGFVNPSLHLFIDVFASAN